MGEIRFVGTGKTRGYPYPVCKKLCVMMSSNVHMMPRHSSCMCTGKQSLLIGPFRYGIYKPREVENPIKKGVRSCTSFFFGCSTSRGHRFVKFLTLKVNCIHSFCLKNVKILH